MQLEKCAQSLLRLRGLPELMALGIWTLFHEPLPADRHGSGRRSTFGGSCSVPGLMEWSGGTSPVRAHVPVIVQPRLSVLGELFSRHACRCAATGAVGEQT